MAVDCGLRAAVRLYFEGEQHQSGALYTHGVPMTASSTRKVRTSILLPRDIYARVQALADANDVSVAWIARQAITAYVENQKGSQELPLRAARSRGRDR
jgi:hypothetical protein